MYYVINCNTKIPHEKKKKIELIFLDEEEFNFL